MLRVGLERGLAKLKAEVDQARQLQPHYEGKINVLEGRIEKVAKQTTRLRGEQSILDYTQKKLAAEQQKNKHEISATAVKVASIGSTTREILESLRQDGYDWLGEVPTLPARSGLLS